MGLPGALVSAEILKIERLLTLLPDSSLAYMEWKRLVMRYDVQGAQVHDARLVALMSVHGVRRILTFNVGDFARYGIEVLQPTSI